MDPKNEELLKRLRETFRGEADEHVRSIRSGLFELEKEPEGVKRIELIETIFRDIHSLKGAARSVDLRDIEAVCQPMEGAFSALKRGEMAMSQEGLDVFHRATEFLQQMILSPDAQLTTKERARKKELIEIMGNIPTRGVPNGQAKVPAEQTNTLAVTAAPVKVFQPYEDGVKDELPRMRVEVQNPIETIRIPISKLDPLLLQAEELVQAKLVASQRTIELNEIEQTMTAWKTEFQKSKNRQSPRSASSDKGFIEWNEAKLSEMQDRIASVSKALELDQRTLSKIVDDHMETIKHVMMLPVASLAELFPTLVRDLSRDQGKEVELVVEGTQMEMDKRVLEELKDPLIHIMRNCIDHGIAKPSERKAQDKPPRGRIVLSFGIKNGGQAEIIVSDDGVGIDVTRVRNAAVKAGIISKDEVERLDNAQALALIFQSGVSTSPIITELSGRGLGLAIVRDKVERLGGAVSVETEKGKGTEFRLLLPLTLAMYRGILVRAEEQVFILPTSYVEHVLRVKKENVTTVENRETIVLEGKVLPMARLAAVLKLPVYRSLIKAPGVPVQYLNVLVLTYDATRIAFQVDEVLEERPVLLKGLGRQLARVPNVAGATLLGSGKAVPVLSVPDLMRSAVLPSSAANGNTNVEEAPEVKGRILVVDDSITSRTLLKNILEMAGYSVATAVDGLDGFTQLRSNEFDLVVSDVDMPRLSGFELTAKVRDDKKLREIPIVLVTALESREDRERGIDVGANAYIVKSSFDQSDLLSVISKLI